MRINSLSLGYWRPALSFPCLCHSHTVRGKTDWILLQDTVTDCCTISTAIWVFQLLLATSRSVQYGSVKAACFLVAIVFPAVAFQNEPGTHLWLWGGCGQQDHSSCHVPRECHWPGKQHQSGADPFQNPGSSMDHQCTDNRHHQTVSAPLNRHLTM